MKIVVGGASNVGKSIVGYLTLGNNDIIVIDENAQKLEEISKEYDIQPVLGSVAHPDIQEKVGMNNVDMLIAVTDSDEVNLIACQVAFTLFDVKVKIARVDSEYYLNPLWNTLYNEKSLPVDMVITPDIEISKFLLNILQLPGSNAVYPFLNNKINIFSFRHRNMEIPFMKFSINHINNKLMELEAKIVLIIRENRRIIPNNNTEIFLQKNDIIYISCKTERNIDVMHLFGVDHNPYEKIVIFGGSAISYYLATHLENDNNMISCSIVDDNEERAHKLANRLNNTSVIIGELLSDTILEDSGFNKADISIAVTEKDKDNLLISLMASKNKDLQAISLINSKDYNFLSTNIRNNTILDRSVITISGILHYLRKARINEAYSLGREMGEIWEVRLGDDSTNVDKIVADIKIPQHSSILAVSHNDELIYNFTKYRLQAEDKILIYVSPTDIRQIESIFYR